MKNNNLAYIDKNTWFTLANQLHYSNEQLVFKLLVLILGAYNTQKNLVLNFSKDELREKLGLNDNNLFKRIYRSCEILKSTLIRFENAKIIEPISIIKSCPYNKSDHSLQIVIDDRFEPCLSDLHQFIKFREIIAICKPSAVLFYAFLKSKHQTNIYQVNWQDINSHCELNYKDYSGFKQRFLIPTLFAIKRDSGIVINYKEHKAGKKLSYLSFTIKEDKLLEAPIATSESLTPIPEANKNIVQGGTDLTKKSAKESIDNIQTLIEDIYQHYLNTFRISEKIYRLTPKRKDKIKLRLKDYSVEDIKKAISNIAKDPWEDRYKYRDIAEHICHSVETVEKWLNFKPASEQAYSPAGRSVSMSNKSSDDNLAEFIKFYHTLPDEEKKLSEIQDPFNPTPEEFKRMKEQMQLPYIIFNVKRQEAKGDKNNDARKKTI